MVGYSLYQLMVKAILEKPTKLSFLHDFVTVVKTEVYRFPFNLCGCESEGDYSTGEVTRIVIIHLQFVS